MVAQPQGLGDGLRVKLVRALEAGLDSVDADWLARIEVGAAGTTRATPTCSTWPAWPA